MTTTDFRPKQRADKDVITFCEFTGVRNDTTPERFTNNDLVVANNVVLDNARSLARRAGSTMRYGGAAHSVWASEGDALFAVDAHLYRFDANLVPTLLTANLSGAPISYARAGDNVYFTNGVQTGVALASSVRSWGLEVPALLAAKSHSDLAPGRYLVSATYVRSDGQESGAAGATPVTINPGDGVQLSCPPALEPDVVAVRFYMSTANEEVLYHLATADVRAATFSPMQANIDAMNEPLETQFLQAAPAGQLVAYFKGRMFVACGDVLYPSQPFAYELFDLRDYIQLDGPITMLAPFEGAGGSGFFIGTTKSTGVLLGESPEDFKYVPKADYGVVQGALAFVDGSLYTDGAFGACMLPVWLSRQGICLGTPSLDVTNITRDRYIFDTGAVGAAMYDPDTNQWIAHSGLNSAIVMNTETLTLTTFTEYGYNSFARAFGCNLAARADGLFELVGDDDNGLPINATVQLPTVDFGTSFVKVIERLYVGYRSLAEMVMRVRVDEAPSEFDNVYVLPVASQPGLATQRLKVGKGLAGRYWTFTVNNLDGTGFTLDTIDVKMNRLERRVNGRA
jgi:hypothetical protein